jgi:subtilase family serine protease
LTLLAVAAAVAVVVAGVGASRPAARTAAVRLEPQVLVARGLSSSTPPTTASCRASSGGRTACYQPQQLQAAYDLTPLYQAGVQGQHQTIVIVDAWGSPTVAADLATFDAAFGLPAPPSFRVLTPRGAPPPFASRGKDRFGWAYETSLDVEWAHALAPKASIVLLETPTDEVEGTSGFPDIVAAENYAIAHHLGTVISQSFGATEQTFASKAQVTHLRSAFVAAQKAGVSMLAASGDNGATNLERDATDLYPFRTIGWPASDPLVTAVGGTKLDLDGAGNALAPAAAWNDTFTHPLPTPSASGGGRSAVFSRPGYQYPVRSQTLSRRGIPDVAMSAACTGLVDVYTSESHNGWYPMCGTSEAAPLFAAIVALADQEAGHGLGLLNPALYALASAPSNGLVPVTTGNNTVAFVKGSKTTTVTGFSAHTGYNLVTGLGTIDAAKFVPALVHASKARR